MSKLRMVSLFSGLGSPEIALKELGYDLDILAWCEIDKYAATSYSAIHNEPETKNLQDVRNVHGGEFKNVDILFHGSPCQSFSMVGKHEGGNEGSGTKSSLMWESVRIVSNCLPKVVVWENVKGVLNKNHIDNFNKYLEQLELLGYSNSYKVISPRDIGESQSRQRVFVVSVLNDTPFVFPEYKPVKVRGIGEYLEDNVDTKYIVPYKTAHNFCVGNLSFTSRMIVSAHDEGAFCLVAKAGRDARTNNFVFFDKEHYKLEGIKYKDRKDIVAMLDNDLHIRALTPLEYWRLQGFDDKYYYTAQKAIADTYKHGMLSKADRQMYKQCGNSIHVGVLKSFLDKVFKKVY